MRRLFLALLCFALIVSGGEAFAQVTYTAIGAKKPKNSKAAKIPFVACQSDGTLAKYSGPRADVGTAIFKKALTVEQAKKAIKVRKKKGAPRFSAALVGGKIPFSTKKNLAALEAEIDACVSTIDPFPEVPDTVVGTGTWVDDLRDTTGDVNIDLGIDTETRTLTATTTVSGFPLGIVDAADLPPETYSVTIPEGETSAPFNFDSGFVPGTIEGTAEIDEDTGMFSASGTATHNQNADDFSDTAATYTVTGPLSGPNVGSVTITGNFPAGGNSFSITTQASPPNP